MTNHLKKISKYRPSVLQGTLNFEVGRPRTGLARELPFESRAFSILSIALMVLILAYLYFVAASIFNVIARADAMREMRAIESSTAELEQQYLALSQGVTPQSADSLGLRPIQTTAYVYRPGNAALAPSAHNTI